MKYIKYILLVTLGSIFGLYTMRAQEGVDAKKITYDKIQLERPTGAEYLDVSFLLQASKKIRSQELVKVMPALVSEDGFHRQALDTFYIAGKGRYHRICRETKLNDLDEETPSIEQVSRLKDVLDAPIHVAKQIPFERWMAQSHIEVRVDVSGCAACGLAEEVETLASIDLPMFTPEDYVFNFVEPEAVEFKRYEEKFDAKINFQSARHNLLKNFKNNTAELKRLDDFVDKALKIKGATLDKIYISGYASPEGNFAYNKALSERRARTLANYVMQEHPALKRVSDTKIVGEGEDWVGLRKAVKEDVNLDKKEGVIAAIDAYSTDTEREAAIRKLDGGKTYKELVETVYPALRRTTFSMGYQVRAFKVEELDEVFKTNQSLMSHNEIYQYAQLLADQGKSPMKAYEAAYKRFGADRIAALNYANALLKYEQNAEKAILLLNTIEKKDADVLLPLAIAYDMQGDKAKAEMILRQAAEAGSDYAKKIMKM